MRATCSVQVLRPFARYLARLGRDRDSWLARFGLTAAALDERDRRLPHAHAMALLRDAVVLSGDRAIGLRAARCEEPGDFDVMQYATANCASVGEALQLAARLLALAHDGIALELSVAPPLAVLQLRVRSDLAPPEPVAIEFLFAVLLAYGSRSVGHPTRPLRVELAHPAPLDRGPYEEAFREARFGAAANAMWVSAAALERPYRASDRSLLQILTRHADGLLQQLALPVASFADRTRAAITETLSAGAGAERVARRLAVSLRTLHRRLAEEGTSHGHLVDEVRRTQAMLHLGNSQLSIAEIAAMLGFAHPNGFHKAFKRWTHMTPAQYRECAATAQRGSLGL
ncbi:AraC family transcriptional regulator [Pendulispora albinea]|uniref:AraC family transcriptional regulator n=1 Tax=Pendulispora albinea TaxID=2741071 RepID=A0ABZ2LYC5_9BACT